MKKYIIISTYPDAGSKNIGDQLITTALIEAIKLVKGDNILVDVVWREDAWDNIKDKIKIADAIIFACLAIRPNMSTKEYPYLGQLLKLNIPLAVISSGTSLSVSPWRKSIYNYVTNESKAQLLALDEKAIFFTTRGYLTQQFCKELGMNNAVFSGDIAFFDNNKYIKKFEKNKEIKTIIVSDPHYSKEFLKSFSTLINGLKCNFPKAKICIALHGNDPVIREYAEENNIFYQEIFEDKEKGLSIYDNADLHVGFRVHAHVSSLKRGMYSYLLEQDGRGCDYGLTINRKISIPNYRPPKNNFDKLLSKLRMNRQTASTSPAEQIIALINQDRLMGFEKFVGLEEQIKSFSNLMLASLVKLP